MKNDKRNEEMTKSYKSHVIQKHATFTHSLIHTKQGHKNTWINIQGLTYFYIPGFNLLEKQKYP